MMSWAREWAKEGLALDWHRLLLPRGFVVSPRRWVLLVTLLALVVQVYPAGAFGTLKDYLATIVVGATSTVALNFLQGPLTGLFTRLRS